MNAHTPHAPVSAIPREAIKAWSRCQRDGDTQSATCTAASALKQATYAPRAAMLRGHRRTLKLEA